MTEMTLFTLCFLISMVLHGTADAFLVPTYEEYRFREGSVYCKDGSCEFKDGVLDKDGATAYGTFNDTLMVTGWGVLDLVAGRGSNNSTDNDVMFAAGFLEGVFTAHRVKDHMQNMAAYFLHSKTYPDFENLGEFYRWFTEQRAWADTMVENNPDNALWRHVAYLNSQLDGFVAGTKTVLSDWDWKYAAWLNGLGDVIDLNEYILNHKHNDWDELTAREAEFEFHRAGHCSVLIKLLPGIENIYMAHNSWFTYGATNRIYKYYDLNVQDEATVMKKMSFSSYPGMLSSFDDFYIMDTELVMLQTSIAINNRRLHSKIIPHALSSWQRVRAANMMAAGGQDWSEIVAKYNSGTYNNQYMVIDLKQIELNSVVKDNALWVVEQIPGLSVADDLTPILRKDGYFAGYNIPYFTKTYNTAGFRGRGDSFSYQDAARAKIFRRDQGNVHDMTSMQGLMRYNNYLWDPISDNDPWKTICSRGDLSTWRPLNEGCYDAKVTDFAMAKDLQAKAISGPDVDALSGFNWRHCAPYDGEPCVGLPMDYSRFRWETMTPKFSSEE